jgi:hypothetical protein
MQPNLQRSNAYVEFPAHQQQKRLLLLLKRGRWPYYAAMILIACAFWLWFDRTADRLIGFWKV